MARFERRETGIVLRVRLTPKGGRDAVEGWQQPVPGEFYLKARVRAVPEDGKANKALIALLAKLAQRPKSQVSLIAGTTSRLKTLMIAGDAGELAAIFEAIGEVS